MKNSKLKPTHVVGIGASAGGLEALQSLFASFPTNLGIAYVVVQHLSSDFKSMMDELLSKNTSMPVHQAQEGEEVLADHVYLIPSGKLMRIAEGRIYLSDLPPDNRTNLPINEFFRSLAEDQQNHAIGVILSGTGSDGSRGVQALKEVGALVIAQDPDEAQFDGMPVSAINTGSVDFILSTKEMSAQIARFVSHPLTANKADLFRIHLSENGETLEKILETIQEHTDLDFKAYKESTVARRIEHRMGINNKTTLKDYLNYMESHDEEIELLKQDLLIGVTQFFRDSEVWDEIYESVIITLLNKGKKDEPIRVWSTGCSTGEEPYTIGILFLEAMERLQIQRQVKIFASDIDQTAVASGAAGIFPASIQTEVPKKYLYKYFNQLADGGYQVTKELRSLVVFATHNLIQDPPFSNMDLISCRNTLIYLQTQAQQKALAFFHFALKINGFLLLGGAETPGTLSTYFEIVESRLRLYKKTRDLRIPVASIANSNGIRSHRGGYHPKAIPQFLARAAKTLNIPKKVGIGRDALVNEYVPPTLIFNNKLQVIYSYGDTSLFTAKLKPGQVTNDISDILEQKIVSHAISAAHQVVRENKSVLFNNVFESLDNNNKSTSWSIKCFMIEEKDGIDDLIALSFIKDNNFIPRIADIEYSVDQQVEQRMLELDNSLVECQKLYREVLEELDSTSEELQSSNEELMAANEELQSTNEELQSVNEELYTVNSEYQQKIVELTNINDDLENLLKATKLAVLFLDKELKIRRFTPALKQYVNIIEFDIDRDFQDLSLKRNFEGLYEMIDMVNKTGEPMQKVFLEEDTFNHIIEIAVAPYITGKQHKGVVISIRENIS